MQLGPLCLLFLLAFAIEGRVIKRDVADGGDDSSSDEDAVTGTKHQELLENLRAHVKEDLDNQEVDEKADEEADEHEHEKNYEHVKPDGDNLEEANEKDGGMDERYEGDIVLTNKQLEEMQPAAAAKRQALGASMTNNGLWQTFYYAFDPSLPEGHRRVFRKAANIWQNNLCINFVENQSATPRVRVFFGQGCYSLLGRVHSQSSQDISLGQGCDSVGTAMHEIGHALGFWHEQARHDRDQNIEVMQNNILNGWLSQFDKQNTQTNENYNMPYDYGSVMHYGGTSVSGNGGITMRARVPQYQSTMGGDQLSFRDIAMMNIRYKCQDRCRSVANPCRNGGIQNSRSCNQCLCPSGLGGATCTDRPAGCGETINVPSGRTVSRTITFNPFNNQMQDEHAKCNYMITTDAGRKIRARITSISSGTCSAGCQYEGVEMKWRRPLLLSGSRFCCQTDINQYITSEDNMLPVVFYNRFRQQTYALEFTSV